MQWCSPKGGKGVFLGLQHHYCVLGLMAGLDWGAQLANPASPERISVIAREGCWVDQYVYFPYWPFLWVPGGLRQLCELPQANCISSSQTGQLFAFSPRQPFPVGVFLPWPCILLGLDPWARDWLQLSPNGKVQQAHTGALLELFRRTLWAHSVWSCFHPEWAAQTHSAVELMCVLWEEYLKCLFARKLI